MIANRLSEVSDWNVLLLEAGDDESMTGQIPVLAASLQLSNVDWQYKTEPQENACLGYLNKQYVFNHSIKIVLNPINQLTI